eukprot:scpid43106/ scgid2353/ Titin; Connectin; Rhabdomyosarcoma antigen MU-RMS-40.14
MALVPHRSPFVFLIISSILCCAQAQLPGGGPLEEFHVSGSNVTAVTCNTSDPTTIRFVHLGAGGVSAAQLVPFYDASDSTQTEFQRLISNTSSYFIYQLHIINYDGIRAVYGCGPVTSLATSQYTILRTEPILGLATVDGASTGLGHQPAIPHVFNEGSPIPPVVCFPNTGQPTRNTVTLNITYDDGRTETFRPPPVARGVDFPIRSARNSSGVYVCYAANEANTGPFPPIVFTFNVTVYFRPDFSNTERERSVVEGTRLFLTVYVSSRPDLSAFDLVSPSGASSSLLSQYQAAAPTNNLMTERKVTALDVASADSTHNGVYVCEATNQISGGPGSSSVNITVRVISPPGAPRNITLLSNASTFIELSYVQPADDGNSNIIGYRVMCSTDFGDASREGHVVVANVSALTANITGLYAGETYTCTVEARNEAGFGASASRSEIELLPGEPCAPVVMQNFGPDSLSLQVIYPCDGGNAATCTIRRSPPDGFSSDISMCTIGQRINVNDSTAVVGTTYTYTITINNGLGPVSTTFSASIMTAPPSPTTTVQLQSTGLPNTPSVTVQTTNEAITEEARGGLSGGAIAGIIIGVIVLIVLVVLLVVIILRNRDKPSGNSTAGVSYRKTNTEASSPPKDELHYANVDHAHKDGAKGGAAAANKGTQSTNYAPLDFDKSGKKGDAENPVGAASTIV